jgi:hypothetical protein
MVSELPHATVLFAEIHVASIERHPENEQSKNADVQNVASRPCHEVSPFASGHCRSRNAHMGDSYLSKRYAAMIAMTTIAIKIGKRFVSFTLGHGHLITG